MELTIVKKVKADGARITYVIRPDSGETLFTLSYTCPDCAGYGCNNHGNVNNRECSGGTVHKDLDPSTLNIVFSPVQVLTIKSAITSLYEAVKEG